MAVQSTRTDLVPPVGAGAGLPLTLVWADDLTDVGGASTAGYALFDTTLWKTPSATATQAAVPTTVSGSNISYAHGTLLDFDRLNFLGLTTEIGAPRLNFGTGWLEHGQAIQDTGFGRHSVSNIRSFAPAVTATVTEAGRHVEHPRRSHTASARPANHTWQQPRHNTLKRAISSYDLQIGSVIDEDAGSIGTVESFTHASFVDLPSILGTLGIEPHGESRSIVRWSRIISTRLPEHFNSPQP